MVSQASSGHLKGKFCSNAATRNEFEPGLAQTVRTLDTYVVTIHGLARALIELPIMGKIRSNLATEHEIPWFSAHIEEEIYSSSSTLFMDTAEARALRASRGLVWISGNRSST